MYRLLVVDDEQIVLDSISFIVKKNFKSVYVETARSGREAIEKAENTRPDIILMDIKMPGINGIEAIREIKSTHRDTVFVIISAYEKFDFAKEAIELGVVEYLLKPVNKEKIIKIINRSIDMVAKERSRRTKELELREKYESLFPIIESELVYSMIFSGSYNPGVDEYRRLNLDVKGPGYMVTIKLCRDEDAGVCRTGEGRFNSIYTQIKNNIKSVTDCLVGPLMLDKIPVFVPASQDASRSMDNILREMEEVYRTIYRKACKHVYIGIGNCYESIDDMPKSYHESINAIKRRKDRYVSYIGDVKEETDASYEYPLLLEEYFLEKASYGYWEEAVDAFNRIFDWLAETYQFALEDIKSKVLELIIIIRRYSYQDAVNTESNYLREITSIEDISSLGIWSRERIREITARISEKRKKQASTIVLKAREYISSNFSNPITLEQVADAIGINSHYLSRLYKEETGENFIDSLTRVRIDEAKELLRGTDLSIKEITFRIGYSDPNYFSRIFKKVEGVTPTEFKGIS